MSAVARVLVAVVWGIVVLLVAHRADGLLSYAIAAWERVRTPVALERFTPEPIPNDLEALVNSETELWAREDMAKLIREKHEEYHGNWDRVRGAFGLGALS